jgi:hypothetical protein
MVDDPHSIVRTEESAPVADRAGSKVAVAPTSFSRLRQLGIFSSARLISAVAVVGGLVIAVTLAAVFVGWAAVDARGGGADGDAERWGAAVLAVSAVLILPPAAAACGWFCGLLGAVLYNLFAHLTGGIEVDLS